MLNPRSMKVQSGLRLAAALCGMSAAVATAQPANDDCANATILSAPAEAHGTTRGASIDGTGACGASSSSRDVWYSVSNTSTRESRCTAALCGSGFDTVLVLFAGCGGEELACNDDSCGRNARLTFSILPGETRLVRVAGFESEKGDFVLRLTAEQVGETCRADFNRSGDVTVQDVFDFLSAYLSNDLSTRYNNAAASSVQDVFDFLAAYFAGC